MIKFLVTDVDGTLTDGKIYIGSDGEAMKAFSIKDGMAPNYILRPNGIEPIVITARNSQIVLNRCKELGITQVLQGRLDKVVALKEIVGEDNLGSCSYFGDDLLDLDCMKPIKEAGGVAGCPADAVSEVRAFVDYVCDLKAGEGALREFSEWLVRPHEDEAEIAGRVKSALAYLQGLHVTEADAGERYEVDENFYYTVQSYETRPAEECWLESHRKCIDIQLIVEGEEAMDIADISRLSVKEPYNVASDVMFWNIPVRMARTVLSAKDCIVLYPENAHRGAITLNSPCKVLKVVGKVRID